MVTIVTCPEEGKDSDLHKWKFKISKNPELLKFKFLDLQNGYKMDNLKLKWLIVFK